MRQAVRKSACALTRYECVAIMGIIFVLLLLLVALLLPAWACFREQQRKVKCGEKMACIGQAISMYREDNSGYFPFSWMPADAGAPRRKDALTSLGCLYPGYVTDAKLFACPVVETSHPLFHLNAPFPIRDTNTDGHITEADLLSGQEHLWNQRNYTIIASDYGYDCRIRPKVGAPHAIAADMDGTWTYSYNWDCGTSNHANGQHTLFADGCVKWTSVIYTPDSNFVDHLFAENPWHADTDSFISDNTAALSDAESVEHWYNNDTPDQYNNLSVSYDAYPGLHPKE